MRPLKIILVFVFVAFKLNAQKQETEKFIFENKLSFDSLLPSNIYANNFMKESLDNKLFLTGEGHNLPGNYEIETSLIKYLYYKANVRFYVIELQVSLSNLFNSYVLNNDKNSLSILEGIMGYKEKLRVLKFIRDFNINLPDSSKIKIVTIDIDDMGVFSIEALQKIIPKNSPPESIKKIIEKIRAIKISPDIYQNRSYKRLSRKLYYSVQNYKDDYKLYLPDSYDWFCLVSKAFYLGMKYPSKDYKEKIKIVNARESFLYEAMKYAIKNNPQANFFGSLGAGHTSLMPVKEWTYKEQYTSMASMLNEDSVAKNKVCSMLIDYVGNSTNIKILKEEDYNCFLNNSDEKFTLFKLTGNNSPFSDLSKVVQYLIINKAN